MADICELTYADYVKVGDDPYFVFHTDFEKRTAGLVPIDVLDLYADNEEKLSEYSETFPVARIQHIPPVRADEETLRSLFRMDVTSWRLVKAGQYPFGEASGKFPVTEDDVLTLIRNLLIKTPNPIEIDVWNDNFGNGRYCHAAYPRQEEPGFTLAFLCEKVRNVMDWLEPEEDDWHYIAELAEDYQKSKGKPLKEIILPEDFKDEMLYQIEKYAENHPVTEEMREYYVATMDELCRQQDPFELKRKAYAYYGGNSVVPCDWKKSEETLLALFELNGDEYAANSLGYIYYSDRLGAPDYDKAFYYFSWADGFGVTEATYKLSDMYCKGHGTEKDPERAWQLLCGAYNSCNEKKKYSRKYPDIRLRMGYCYRDGIGVDRDIEKARTCFYEAKEGIELRMKRHKGFGDETVLKNILSAIAELEADS